MKTAVEYLYTQLQMNNEILEKGTRVHQEMEKKIFDQAKEMEKQQIKNSWIDGRFDWGKHFNEAEQYYNETFKNNEQ